MAYSGLVYQYEGECKKVYIDETCCSIRTREIEHKRAIRNMDENHSGILKHVLETGHFITWEGVKILAYTTAWKKRKINPRRAGGGGVNITPPPVVRK